MKEIKKLNQFKINEIGRVVNIDACGKIKQRFYDMGITTGTEIRLLSVAPSGDPMQISLRGYKLSIRANEANFINMEI